MQTQTGAFLAEQARTPMTNPVRRRPASASAGRTLQMIRAGYGAALVLVPGPAIYLATGSLPGPRTRRTAQLLGARHLIQAALTAVRPDPGMFTLGGQVDAVHAASMLLLAGISRPARRAALADTLAEAAFAAAGFSVPIRAKFLARA